MAEGQTRLNQQVVDNVYWDQSTRVGPSPDRPWAPSPDVCERERRLDDIRRAVETDIIPRVAGEHDRAAPVALSTVTEGEVRELVEILLRHDDEATVSAHVAAVLARGIPIDHIYLQLFQPAARYIGELWCDDLCTFVDVTLAVGTMQKLLRTLGATFHMNGRAIDSARQAMLVPLPGDQHTFGLSMVAEFFRRAGWGVWSAPFGSREGLSDAVQKDWFAVVGFSASSDRHLDELATVISRTRRDSCNRSVGIMVGGPLFVEHPEFVARVGADAMGVDATQALARAESFVAPAASP